MKNKLMIAVLALAALPVLAGDLNLNCPAGTTQSGGPGSNWGSAGCVVSGEGQSRTLSGPFIAYWPNGVKQAEGQMVKNERVGTWTTFDKNGVKLTTVSFKNDKWNGERTHFFPSGQKKMVETFDNGVLVAVQSFNQLGQPVESGTKTN